MSGEKKRLKDMTEEELKEYKREYSKKYYENKRKIAEEKKEENITRRLSGRSKKTYMSDRRTEQSVVNFSESTEDIGGLTINNGMGIFSIKGIHSFNEFFCLLVIKAAETRRENNRAFIVGVVRVHSLLSREMAKTKRSILQIDISDKIDELNNGNYEKMCSKYQRDFFNQLKKMDVDNFCKLMMEHADGPMDMAKVLYKSLDEKYIIDNNIALDDIFEFNKGRKTKNVKGRRKRV